MRLLLRAALVAALPAFISACGEPPTGSPPLDGDAITASPNGFRGVRTAGPDASFVCYTSEPAGARGYRYRRVRLPIPAEALGGPLGGAQPVTFRIRFQDPGKNPVAAANCRIPGTPAAVEWMYKRLLFLNERRRLNRTPNGPRFDYPCSGPSGCVLAPLVVTASGGSWGGGVVPWPNWGSSQGDQPSYGGGWDPGTPTNEDPCPEQYTVLNDPNVQDGFKDMMQRSNPDAQMKDRREQGGFLVNHGDGTFGIVPFPPEWSSDPCKINVPPTITSPPGTVALVHTHPYTYHESLTSCPLQELPNGTKVPLNYSGDSSWDDDKTMAALRERYPELIGIVLDKDHLVVYDGDGTHNMFIPRCGY